MKFHSVGFVDMASSLRVALNASGIAIVALA